MCFHSRTLQRWSNADTLSLSCTQLSPSGSVVADRELTGGSSSSCISCSCFHVVQMFAVQVKVSGRTSNLGTLVPHVRASVCMQCILCAHKPAYRDGLVRIQESLQPSYTSMHTTNSSPVIQTHMQTQKHV